jgi:hypothetical protein
MEKSDHFHFERRPMHHTYNQSENIELKRILENQILQNNQVQNSLVTHQNQYIETHRKDLSILSAKISELVTFLHHKQQQLL